MKKRKLSGVVALSHVNNKVKVQKVQKKASSAGMSADIWKELADITLMPDVYDEHTAALKKESSLSKPDNAKNKRAVKVNI